MSNNFKKTLISLTLASAIVGQSTGYFFASAYGDKTETVKASEEIDIDALGGGPSPSAAWTVKRRGVARNMTVRDIDRAIRICNHQLNKALRMDEIVEMGGFIADCLGTEAQFVYGTFNFLYDGMYRMGWSEKAVVERSLQILKSARIRAQKNGLANIKVTILERPANGETMFVWYWID